MKDSLCYSVLPRTHFPFSGFSSTEIGGTDGSSCPLRSLTQQGHCSAALVLVLYLVFLKFIFIYFFSIHPCSCSWGVAVPQGTPNLFQSRVGLLQEALSATSLAQLFWGCFSERDTFVSACQERVSMLDPTKFGGIGSPAPSFPSQ